MDKKSEFCIFLTTQIVFKIVLLQYTELSLLNSSAMQF